LVTIQFNFFSVIAISWDKFVKESAYDTLEKKLLMG